MMTFIYLKKTVKYIFSFQLYLLESFDLHFIMSNIRSKLLRATCSSLIHSGWSRYVNSKRCVTTKIMNKGGETKFKTTPLSLSFLGREGRWGRGGGRDWAYLGTLRPCLVTNAGNFTDSASSMPRAGN